MSTIKKTTNYIAVLCILISINSFAQDTRWARVYGESSSHMYGLAVDVDDAGNVYKTGYFDGIMFSSNSNGTYDVFISKLDKNGNLIWGKTIGGATNDRGKSITVDALGNVYVVGEFNGSVDFDPSAAGTFTLTSAGFEDIFITKLDNDGNFIWAKSFGNTNYDGGISITTDANGDLLSTGYFNGTVDFDPNGGITNLSSTADGCFVLKLDVNGNFIWAKLLGGSGADRGYSITTDATNNIITTGFFAGTADFDPSATINNLVSVGSYDVFVSKLDANGNYIWAKSFGSTGLDEGYSVATDISGNVYTSGAYTGTTDFNPSLAVADTFKLTSAGFQDLFISKLDVTGNFIWAKSMGSTGSDYSYSIALDTASNVYTTGYFQSTVDFDPSPVSTYNMTSPGGLSVFISKLNTAGNFIYAKQIGASTSTHGMSIALDTLCNIYIVGDFGGNVDFDPGAAAINSNSIGATAAFAIKMPQCTITLTTTTTQANCYSDNGTASASASNGAGSYTYLWSVGSLTTSIITGLAAGNYTVTATDFNSCNVNNNVTITQQLPATIVVTATVNAAPITSGELFLFKQNILNNRMDTIKIETLSSSTFTFLGIEPGNYLVYFKPDASLNPNTSGTYNGNVTDWIAGIITTATCNANYSVTINATTFATFSGPGLISGKVQKGVKFGKTNTVGDPIPGVDISLEQNPGGIMVSQTETDVNGNYSFSNLPLDDYRIKVNIPGTPHSSYYDVTIDNAGPSKTDLVYVVDSAEIYPLSDNVNISNADAKNSFKVIPNPFDKDAQVILPSEWKNNNQELLITITDISGKLVYSKKCNSSSDSTIKRDNLENGMYFIKIENDTKSVTQKIILID